MGERDTGYGRDWRRRGPSVSLRVGRTARRESNGKYKSEDVALLEGYPPMSQKRDTSAGSGQASGTHLPGGAGEQQIPCGNDRKKSNGNDKATAKAAVDFRSDDRMYAKNFRDRTLARESLLHKEQAFWCRCRQCFRQNSGDREATVAPRRFGRGGWARRQTLRAGLGDHLGYPDAEY
jgi:hypothetical protein